MSPASTTTPPPGPTGRFSSWPNPTSTVADTVGDSITVTNGAGNPASPYVPANTFAVPQGDALGFYESAGIIPAASPANGYDYFDQEQGAAPPTRGKSVCFSSTSGNPNCPTDPGLTRDYAYTGNFQPATKLVIQPGSGEDQVNSPAQDGYTVSFQTQGGTVVPENADAANIDLSSTDGTIVKCYSNTVITHPIAEIDGEYSFCIEPGSQEGPNTITASDPNAGGAITDGTATLTQYGAATNVAVQVSGNPRSDQATVTATVTDAAGDPVPGDNVDFSASPSGPSFNPNPVYTDASGVATTTYTESGHSSEAFRITATDESTGAYGSAEYQRSPSGAGVVATSASTPSSSHNPSLAGQQLTFTVTLSPVPDGGTVQFTDPGTTIPGCGAVPVNTTTGQASCTTSFSTPGSYQVQAIYSGDASFSSSQSSVITQVVRARRSPRATSLHLRSSTNPVVVGRRVTYTARVSPAPHAGHVTFLSDGHVIGRCWKVALSSTGTATCTLTYTRRGARTIQARYTGTARFTKSVSRKLTEMVKAKP